MLPAYTSHSLSLEILGMYSCPHSASGLPNSIAYEVRVIRSLVLSLKTSGIVGPTLLT